MLQYIRIGRRILAAFGALALTGGAIGCRPSVARRAFEKPNWPTFTPPPGGIVAQSDALLTFLTENLPPDSSILVQVVQTRLALGEVAGARAALERFSGPWRKLVAAVDKDDPQITALKSRTASLEALVPLFEKAGDATTARNLRTSLYTRNISPYIADPSRTARECAVRGDRNGLRACLRTHLDAIDETALLDIVAQGLGVDVREAIRARLAKRDGMPSTKEAMWRVLVGDTAGARDALRRQRGFEAVPLAQILEKAPLTPEMRRTFEAEAVALSRRKGGDGFVAYRLARYLSLQGDRASADRLLSAGASSVQRSLAQRWLARGPLPDVNFGPLWIRDLARRDPARAREAQEESEADFVARDAGLGNVIGEELTRQISTTWMELGDVDRAVAAAQRASLDRGRLRVLTLSSGIALAHGRPADALRMLDLARYQLPAEARVGARIAAAVDLGPVLKRAGDPAGATQALQSVIPLIDSQRRPDLKAAERAMLAGALHACGQKGDAQRQAETAEKDARQATERLESAWAFHHATVARASLGDLPGAVRVAREIPDFWEWRLALLQAARVARGLPATVPELPGRTTGGVMAP